MRVGFWRVRHPSDSVREAPGVIYMSLHPDPLTMAEAIVHETQHTKLNSMTWLDPVLLNGQRARLMERFTIPGWVDYVKTFRPETHGVPPSMMQTLLDLNVTAEDLAPPKAMGCGPATAPPARQAWFEGR